ncbi:uncharacterized protein GGS22DRAFT_57913 [Annulohypoxylon maeteangense]|uniref:uncharacterized protein n=1 Tax=Annulohypoxylon maeteangense TaxID=1927788 RepID=UPI0020073C63|nr:uncharacterized protein GGS22DRAFT_57913 [Annulohypoxylon maeteangense]KAI0881432.1 hypothetical protein GGS22DRAFT_57913 [Annulohypoxylon maeteangense]
MAESSSQLAVPLDAHFPYVPKGPGGRDPATTLPRILNFLTDEDQYRHPGWKQRVKLISKYLQEADEARKAGELGYDIPNVRAMLDDALIILDEQQRSYAWSNGPTPWAMLPLSGQPNSTRLPTSSDQFLKATPDKSRYKRRRIDYPASFNDKNKSPNRVVTSPFVSLTRGGTGLLDLFLADEESYFENPQNPACSARDGINLYKLDNDRYEHCMKGGIRETLKRAPWRHAKDIPEVRELPNTPSSPDKVPDNLQELCLARGWQRAAIQQCLNLFSNHENRVVNTPWRRVILPFREHVMPKELVYYPRALAPEKVPHSLKDPYPFIHQYEKYNELMNNLGSRTRRLYIRDHFNSFRRSALPNNFIGPFIYHGLSVHDDHWLRIGSYLKRLRVLLQDAFAIAPRSFMLAILRDIEAGIESRPDSETAPKYIRNDVMRRPGADEEHEDGDSGPPTLLLIDEADAAWLRFLCEPSTTPLMTDPKKQPQDNLTILFDSRLQSFLNDPNVSGSPVITGEGDIFDISMETWEGYPGGPHPTLEQALAYINGGGDVDANETYQFSYEEAMSYARRSSYLGRCRLLPTADGAGLLVMRPLYEIHPEHRIAWRHDNMEAFDASQASYQQAILDHLAGAYPLDDPYSMEGQFAHILDHIDEPDLPRLLVEATQSGNAAQATRDILSSRIHNELVRARGSYEEGGRGVTRQEPSWSDLTSWDQLGRLRHRKGAALSVPERTVQFYRNLAYRMGRTIAYTRELERRLEIPAPGNNAGENGGENRGSSRWKAISRNALTEDYQFWRKSIQYGTGEIEFKQPTIYRLIEKADPDEELQNRFKDKHEWDLIREGMIDECVLNRNTLYPSREIVLEDSSGTYKSISDWKSNRMFQGVKRPSLWKWATDSQRRYQAPFTRFAFFSMMRWPLMHQSKEWRQFLTSRRDETQRINPRLPQQQYGILAPRLPPQINPQNSSGQYLSTKNTTSDQDTKGPRGTKRVRTRGSEETKHDGTTKPSEETTTPRLRGGMEEEPFLSPLLSPSPSSPSSSSPQQFYQQQPPPPPPTHSGSAENMGAVAPPKTSQPKTPRPKTPGPKTPGPKTPGPKTPAAKRIEKPTLKPFTKPKSRFVPGPAIFPMAETLLQSVAMSNELENVLYPPPKLNFLQKIVKLYNQLTEVPDRRIPLLPPLTESSNRQRDKEPLASLRNLVSPPLVLPTLLAREGSQSRGPKILHRAQD